MSIFNRKNNLKSLTDALNDINKTLKKYNQDQDSRGEGGEVDKNSILNIFDIIKKYWFIIPSVIFVYALYIYIVIYYRVFDYNLPITIEYIQEQITNGFYKWILYSVIFIGIQAVSYIPPFIVIYNFTKQKSENKLYRKIKLVLLVLLTILWVMYCIYMENNSVRNLITIIILGPKKVKQEFGETYKIFMDDPCNYSLWGMVTAGSIVYLYVCRKGGTQAIYNGNLSINNSLFKIFIKVLPIVPILLFASSPWWSPVYRPGFLNGGSTVSCIIGNNGEEPVGVIPLGVIPYKYDTRGVYVFKGNIEPNNGGGKYLSNVNREFLFFEKGYKVTSGACKSGSDMSSAPPPQGQQLP